MGDTSICQLCDELVEEYTYHPLCCPHDDVEEDDGRDGVGGRLRWFCRECGEEVIANEPNEDGETWWELT